MEMLFLGGVFSKEMEEEILNNSKGTVHYAANNFQWALIDGLMEVNEINLEILSAAFVGTYPKEYKKLYYYGKNGGFYKNEVKLNSVSFNNIWGYRNISRKNSLIKSMDKFISKNDNSKVILIYSPHTPFLQAAVYAKQKDPSIQLCLVVPDLPIYMNLNDKKSILYQLLKKVDIRIFESILDAVDSFVLITEYMKDILKVGKRPYVVVEGLVNDSNRYINEENQDNKSEEIKTIVYTGTLNKKFGVLNLVEAFHQIDNPNLVLKICGRGDSFEEINNYAKKDKRIYNLGQITNEKSLELQRNSTVLINPRPNNEEFTKYSFPIKTMEYLLSGKPVIAYKLDGIPNEYNDYIYYIEDNSILSIKNKICEVINLPRKERNEIGEKSRNYILENKSKNKVGLKIYNMISSNNVNRKET